jgi:hypothetical protein
MSSPGPSGGGGSGPKKTKVKKKVTKKKKEEEPERPAVRKDGSATDETASNSDRREDASAAAQPERKPQSAGASMRDAAQRILTLALKAEWTAVEGVIKSLEKAVEKAKAAAEEEVFFAPMAGVSDPVSYAT